MILIISKVYLKIFDNYCLVASIISLFSYPDTLEDTFQKSKSQSYDKAGILEVRPQYAPSFLVVAVALFC